MYIGETHKTHTPSNTFPQICLLACCKCTERFSWLIFEGNCTTILWFIWIILVVLEGITVSFDDHWKYTTSKWMSRWLRSWYAKHPWFGITFNWNWMFSIGHSFFKSSKIPSKKSFKKKPCPWRSHIEDLIWSKNDQYCQKLFLQSKFLIIMYLPDGVQTTKETLKVYLHFIRKNWN